MNCNKMIVTDSMCCPTTGTVTTSEELLALNNQVELLDKTLSTLVVGLEPIIFYNNPTCGDGSNSYRDGSILAKRLYETNCYLGNQIARLQEICTAIDLPKQ